MNAPLRLVLFGDGDSPHLLKWARALAQRSDIALWAASSRGFLPGFDAVLAPDRRLALATRPSATGGNVALLRHLPRLVHWLRKVQPDWVHAHYLSSHGTLAWLAQSALGAPGRLVGSAWGSDILVTPRKSKVMRWATSRVLRHCRLSTSDSQVMARRMHELGAGEVMVFPFGLEAMPPEPAAKEPQLFFANRGLEPVYAPQRVVEIFADIAWHWPQARLVVANDGSLRAAMEQHVRSLRLAERVQFVGRLDADTQARHYAQAQWYLSLPDSDSVAVSVLEAMAWGCIPLLSDLPANRELVRHGDSGLLLPPSQRPNVAEMNVMAEHAALIASRNREWIANNALFAPAVDRFVARLRAFA